MGCLDLEISKSVEFDMIEVGDFNVGENERGTSVAFVGAAAHYEEEGKVQVQCFVSGSASSDTNKNPRIKFVSNALCLAAEVVKVTGTQTWVC